MSLRARITSSQVRRAEAVGGVNLHACPQETRHSSEPQCPRLIPQRPVSITKHLTSDAL